MQAKRSRSVLISGAGIAGPALAHWLLAYGFKPTLVERAAKLRTGGYVVDFWGLGYEIAQKMGLLTELHKCAYNTKELRFVNRRGRRVGGFSADTFRAMTGGRYITVARSDLAQAIYRSLANQCETVFGDSIAAVTENGDSLAVSFERGSQRRFDIVVGADGLHSAVRRCVFGPDSQFETYLGHVAAAFETHGYRPRDEGVYVSFGAPGKHIARFALREDRTLFFMALRLSSSSHIDPHDTPAQKALLHHEFGNEGWECSRILDALDRSENLYFDRVSQIRMDSWSRGRVALVGDAAFSPSLLAGEGASLAMTAAYVLAGELAKAEGEHRQAFARYESRLRDFMTEKQNAARKFAHHLFPGPRSACSSAINYPGHSDSRASPNC